MAFAEEAERELIRLMVENRHGAFSKIEKSHQGETMVMKFLDILEKPTSPKHIAESLNLSSARIAVLLGSLEKKGQIVRNMDPNDRRRINVTLTECGKKQANTEKKKMSDKVIAVFNQMGEEDTKKFVELITKFIDYSHKLPVKEEGDQ
ncbi:transcriptional regulator [Vagococcus sp. BWB3-3]|uniref:Transcriptional regulator n=1 Tax=Vagococcus allomyrinae TaxID=2794353 RepID=A0A940SV43_9ENTE|nr:transcriptional regulator [Vagococcus allomyrinae]MBP1040706.1 transcriptional regulator [Vagococcus allomyrinae]